jgi:Protein of unknown function (DUF992)
VLGAGAPAQAAAGVRIGIRNRNVQGGWGYILGSSKAIHCSSVPNHGAPEYYGGSIAKVGVDIGYTKDGVIVRDIIAPTANVRPGALNGTYGGVTARTTFGDSIRPIVDVGGFDDSIALQPISVIGKTGLNVTGGIGAMSLHYQGATPGPWARLGPP